MIARQTKKKKKDSITKIRKRDGEIIKFDLRNITEAINLAFKETKEGTEKDADKLTKKVYEKLLKIKKWSDNKSFLPSVEMVQDIVEEELILSNYVITAKSYILYRKERERKRYEKGIITSKTKEQIEKSSKYFSTSYNEFIFYRTYSRWNDELGRRETWEEAIDRFMDFMKENLGKKLSKKEYADVKQGILNQEVCPSMRLLWSSGKAARRSNVWAYNCSFIAPTEWRDFGEIMYILMCGAGLGFTVEKEHVAKFSIIKKQTGKKSKTHIIADDKEGWANAFILACKTWESGKDIDFDYSKIRPEGARLKTAGGRSSGPRPLMELIDFSRDLFFSRQGKKLRPIDIHDIICKIGLIVVAGGVRRSSLISLSDLGDKEMRDSKQGQFWLQNGQRVMANNSAVYEEKPNSEVFLDEWMSLIKSGTGERGIFNRSGFETQLPKRRWDIVKKKNIKLGVNPCGEILLKSKQFCNLTSIVVRPNDKLEDLKRKVRLATILGTYQSSLTNFGYISKEWKKNCDEEALLGVSITGYYDNEMIRKDKVLEELKKEAINTNKKYAKKIGVNESTSITTIKPHGNSGQLLNVGSGMHPWYSPYYIRRVRISRSDPLFKLARDSKVPVFPEVGYTMENSQTMVLEFPVAAPKKAIFKDEVSAIDLLKEWKRLKEHYVEHNPSVTIYVSPDEWIKVANFVYENWDVIGGLSFLPRSEHVYKLAPYEEITEGEYHKRTKEINKIDFSKLIYYEKEDNTEGSKEYACVSGVCSIDDILAEGANKEDGEKK